MKESTFEWAKKQMRKAETAKQEAFGRVGISDEQLERLTAKVRHWNAIVKQMSRSEAKKPIFGHICPGCNTEVLPRGNKKISFCPDCAQAILWEE